MTSSNSDELAMQPAAHKASNSPLHQVLCVLLLPLLPSGSSITFQIAEAAHCEDAPIDFAPCHQWLTLSPSHSCLQAISDGAS